MATRSPVAFHAYWGIFSTVGDLPNVAGAATQSNTLQVGDQAYSTAEAMIYFCIDATVGAAIWSAMGLGPANFDAFGRLRVSNPQTIFDAKTVYDAQPLYFAEQQTGGAAAGVWSASNASVALTVAANQTSVRQSRRYLNYQPGKSQLIFLTFNLNGIVANTIKRAGYYEGDGGVPPGNGFFLELSGGVASLHRRSSSSTASVSVNQASWNLDPMNGSGPSGVTLDFSDVQILVLDFEWLGVGSARMGFVINGQIIYAHRFDCANVNQAVYMSTPNLPVRWEIQGLAGLVGTDSINCICASVNSEGGIEATGSPFGVYSPRSTNVANNAATTLLSIRHRAGFERVTIIPTQVGPITAGNGASQWELLYNPTFAVAPGWATSRGFCDIDTPAVTAAAGQATIGPNTAVIAAGVFSQNTGAVELNFRDTTLTLGADVAGVSDVISLVVTNVSGGAEQYLAGLNWIALT